VCYDKIYLQRSEKEKMRILICDDDTLFLEQLQKYLKVFFDTKHIKCPEIISFTSGEELLADKETKDIVFLDVEMPGMNGIYAGNELKKQNKNIIIFVVTSYSEYLDDAMRFHVFRYLSKPLDKQRFYRNLTDALMYYNTMTQKIPIETRDGIYTVASSYIIAIEAQSRKVIVHTTKRNFISIHNMNYWAEHLPKNCFFQTHRSFIINFEHVTDFSHATVQMVDNSLIAYLTRRRYSAFKNAYLLYLESTR